MTEIQPCPHGHTPGTCRACLHAENERLKTALATANANHERFEREWYLRGDEIERLQADLQKALANHTADLSGLEPFAENERLKRQVDELSTHAEKWVKRALARTEDGPGPCDLVQQMRLAGYHDWASAVERLQRPAHEREPPHCANCSCGMAPEPGALETEVARMRKLFWLAKEDVIFFSGYDEKTDTWPDIDFFYRPCVIVNDTFGYACADAQQLHDFEIDRLIEAHKQWGYDGVVAWASLIRKCEPIVERRTPAYCEARVVLSGAAKPPGDGQS